MSGYFGIGYSGNASDSFEVLVSELGSDLGIYIKRLSQQKDLEISEALSQTSNHLGWTENLFVSDCVDKDQFTSGNLEKSITDYEITGVYPKFFTFIKKLDGETDIKSNNIFFFFCDEWKKNDLVRYYSGTLDNLILLLSSTGGWGGRFLVPQSGHLQNLDETPMVFEVHE